MLLGSRERKSYDLGIVISDLGAGGAQRVLTTLLHSWVNHRRVVVITLDEEQNDFYLLPEGVDRCVIGEVQQSRNVFIGLFLNLKRIFLLRRQLRIINAPVVISFICPTNILTIMASWGLRLRIIVSERNDPSRQSFGRIWDGLRRCFYRFADVVTANTRGALGTMRAYVPSRKLQYVPNPILLASNEDDMHFSNPTILTVGRLHRQKAHDVLLHAFSRFVKEYPEWQLVIVGDGPLREYLHRLAESLGIDHSVKWYSGVRNIAAFYKAATFFVLPSRYEGMPNALLEAMSCGLPAVVSDASPGPLEYVDHDRSGLVVTVGDVDSLYFAMKRLSIDTALRDRLSNSALLKIKENTLEYVLNQWESVLSIGRQTIYEKN